MGNKVEKKVEITKEELYDSVKFLMLHQGINFTKGEIQKPMKNIMIKIQQQHPFKQEEDGIMTINDSLIRMFYCPYFIKQMLKILKHFMEKLQQINKKSFVFVKVAEIQYLTLVANFILFFSNENILVLLDSLLVRSDVSQANKATLAEIRSREDEVQIAENLVQKLAEEEVLAVQKVLRITIFNFINLRQQALTRSEETLKSVSYLEQSLFLLYTKIYFSQPSLYDGNRQHSDASKQREHFRRNMTIGAYFLASGSSYIKPSIFQTAVLFIYSLMNVLPKQRNNKQKFLEIKTLPSHLFKNLPVVPSNSLYDYIACNILFSLKYINEGKARFIRFSFNRIQSLKLVQKLLKQLKLSSQSITYYIEELCLQVKVGQIERACMHQIAKIYLQILSQKGEKSDILKKFIDNSDLKYNLKFANKQIKVSTDQLLTQLEDENDLYSKEYSFYSEKYLYQNVIFQPMNYNFNDRLIWNEILPNIMLNKEDQEVMYESNNGKNLMKQQPQEIKQSQDLLVQKPDLRNFGEQKSEKYQNIQKQKGIINQDDAKMQYNEIHQQLPAQNKLGKIQAAQQVVLGQKQKNQEIKAEQNIVNQPQSSQIQHQQSKPEQNEQNQQNQSTEKNQSNEKNDQNEQNEQNGDNLPKQPKIDDRQQEQS